MSTKLTKKQALELAKVFKASALSVGNYTVEHWAELTSFQREQLNSIEWSLFNASEDMINLATQLATSSRQDLCHEPRGLRAQLRGGDRVRPPQERIGTSSKE